MGIVVRFPNARHARAPVRSCERASRSQVIPLTRCALAKSTTAGHRLGGIPRSRQLLTTGGEMPNPSATLVVPPSSSMMPSSDMSPVYFTGRERVKVHGLAGDFSAAPTTICPMGTDAKDIGKRLRALHAALEISQADVCRATGLKANRYSQYVNGERPLTLVAGVQLVKVFPITLDWLFLGDVSALSMELHRKLQRAA